MIRKYNIIEGLTKSKLNTISLSKTSAGVLCKWETWSNGELFYCKSGTCSAGLFNSRQPQAEVMASRIAKQLNLKGYIETFYFKAHFNETDEYIEQDALISCTKDFLEENESYGGIHKFLSPNELKSNDLYNLIVNKFPKYKDLINEIIVFDFIILNIDRHLNNFGFITNEENEIVRIAPLFDNGLSLLANLSDSEIKELSDLFIDKKMKVKPFSGDPYKQIKKVTNIDLNKVISNEVLELNWNLIFEGLDINDFRKDKIKFFVQRRLEYVKALLSKS